MVERWRCSNNGEALVAGDEVPGVLQLEEGKGECEVRFQWETMAARVELTEKMGRWRCYNQNLVARGISGGLEWAESQGEKGGLFTWPWEKKWGGGEKGGRCARRVEVVDGQRGGTVMPHGQSEQGRG
jgi:hypothetical protein